MSSRRSKSARSTRSRSRSIGSKDLVLATPVIETPVIVESKSDRTPAHRAAKQGLDVVYGIFLVALLVFSIIFLTKLHTYALPDGTKVLNTENGKVLYGSLITAVIVSMLSLLVSVVTGRGIGMLLALVAFVANILVLVYMKKLWDQGARSAKGHMKDEFSAKFVYWGIVANFVLAGVMIVVGIFHDKKEGNL